MKRATKLFDQICDIQNLHEAYYKASKSKRLSAEVMIFNQNYEQNLEKLRCSLIEGCYKHGKYRQFTIIDPKERIISAAPFADRIVHHAIINMLEPVFERQFIFHTYACRSGKGTHAAARYAFKKAKSCKYFLKLDVRKYFDSINHSILKNFLCRIIKDSCCLALLFGVIDTYCVNQNELNVSDKKGLPIGNLTSQFFANFYLSSLDHFVLEHLKPCGYVRYMDDIVVFENSKENLKSIFAAIQGFCSENLKLLLKTPVFGLCKNGVPFLGWNISSEKITVLKSTRSRMKSKLSQIENDFLRGRSTLEKSLERITAVYAARVL